MSPFLCVSRYRLQRFDPFGRSHIVIGNKYNLLVARWLRSVGRSLANGTCSRRYCCCSPGDCPWSSLVASHCRLATGQPVHRGTSVVLCLASLWAVPFSSLASFIHPVASKLATAFRPVKKRWLVSEYFKDYVFLSRGLAMAKGRKRR